MLLSAPPPPYVILRPHASQWSKIATHRTERKSSQPLLSSLQSGPGRKVKQEQEKPRIADEYRCRNTENATLFFLLHTKDAKQLLPSSMRRVWAGHVKIAYTFGHCCI